jgi:hypothetical protein
MMRHGGRVIEWRGKAIELIWISLPVEIPGVLRGGNGEVGELWNYVTVYPPLDYSFYQEE